MRYVAVGDSVARGFLFGLPHAPRPGGVRTVFGMALSPFDRPDAGYPALVADRLRAAGVAVSLDMGPTASGAGTDTLWHDGAPHRALVRAMEHGADLVTVTLGANDLGDLWVLYSPGAALGRAVGRLVGVDPEPALDRLAPPPDRVRRRLGAVQHRLSALVDWLVAAGARCVLVTTYYNPYGSRVVLRRFLAPMADVIATACARHPQAHVVDLDAALRRRDPDGTGGLVSAWDGIHLTDAGQAAAADAVMEVLATLEGPWRG